jgi:hypothetical protein
MVRRISANPAKLVLGLSVSTKQDTRTIVPPVVNTHTYR